MNIDLVLWYDGIPIAWELFHLNALLATYDTQDEFYSAQDADTYYVA